MEEKRSSGRAKRPAKPADEGSWDCSVCTYKNSAEAYKCEMCDVRKGTSTRKPRINPQLLNQQVAQQFAAPLSPNPGSPTENEEFVLPLTEPNVVPVPDRLGPPPPPPPKTVPKKEKGSLVNNHTKKDKSNPQKSNAQIKKKARSPALGDIDRSSARQMSVTVDNVTVVITDYLPKKRKVASDSTKNSVQSDTSDSSSNASNDIAEDNSLMENHT